MNYFIFNGIHSGDMGIIVESLPPIVKPPRKYEVIPIEGKSKTIIHDLGYDTYLKRIRMGFKDADIWQVSDWLMGEGKLILGNEPDKYYDVFIHEQIDYEKALRFRKAVISFLVQPYKHYHGEEETESRILINQGNELCLPLMTIYGSGKVGIFVNGVKQCDITIDGYVTLDGEEEEAYKDTLDNRRNRVMEGKFPMLHPGINNITFTGNVTNVKTLVRSRWV